VCLGLYLENYKYIVVLTDIHSNEFRIGFFNLDVVVVVFGI